MELLPCIALKGEYRVMYKGQEVKRGKKAECEAFMALMAVKYKSVLKVA